MLLYAHRGAAAELPENTLPAFRRALELGADALETDAHLTRDGQVVLSHDASGRRMADAPHAIRKCTLREIQTWDAGWGFVDQDGRRPFAGRDFRIPTLAQALEELPGATFNVDLKQGELVPAALQAIRRANAEERVLLASFDSATLRRVRALGYRGATGLGQAEVARLRLLPMALVSRFPPRGLRAQIPLRAYGLALATKDFIARCHALGIAVDYWTVNDADEARRLLALGADGVMTDDPAKVAPAMPKGALGRPPR